MSKLLIIALLSDLFTPILIWKANLPAQIRWLSLVALVVMLALGYARLMTHKYIPKAIWCILCPSVIGVVVALVNDQGVTPTVWGWWLMFRYPLVGLYVYTQPKQSKHFPSRLRILCIGILMLEVVVQIGQYLTGEKPGDNLAGTLGKGGTSHLAMVIFLILAMMLGDWIARGKTMPVFFVIGLGMVSCSLGEVKLFFPGALIMVTLALIIYTWRKGQFLHVLPLAPALLVVSILFPSIYNRIVPGPRNASLETYMSPWEFEQYNTEVRFVRGRFDVGRNTMLDYTWQVISSSMPTLLFGEGLGAWGESVTLGTAGNALRNSNYGLVTGASLPVMLGELGLLSVITVGIFIFWVIITFLKATAIDKSSELASLLYGLVLYSIMWPVWLWYTTAWTLPASMLLYWTAMGYGFSQLPRVAKEPTRPPSHFSSIGISNQR